MGEPEIVLESHSSDGRAGLDVRAGTRTVTLQGWPTDDWPAVPRVAAIDPIASIDASAVVDAFERVALCASGDEARPVLTCVGPVLPGGSARARGRRDRLVPTGRRPVAAGGGVPCLRRPPAGPGARGSGSWPSSSREPKARSRFGLWRHRAESHRARRASRSACPMPSGRFEPSRGSSRTGSRSCRSPEGGSFEFDPEELGSALRAATSVRSTKGAPVRLTLDRTCSLALKDPDLGEMREALTEARFSPNGAGADGGRLQPRLPRRCHPVLRC